MVSIPDSDVNPQLDAFDLGFSKGGATLRAIQYPGESTVFLLDRVDQAADFYVHRGSKSGGAWNQVGKTLNQTPSAMWTDGKTVHLLGNASSGVGIVCTQLAGSAGPSESWLTCPGFPDWGKGGQGQAYSVKGKFMGKGQRVAGWFELKGLKEPAVAVSGAGADGQWRDLGQVTAEAPSAWAFDGDTVLLGFLGESADAVIYRAEFDGDVLSPSAATGLPTPANKWSGAMGICAVNESHYVLYLEYDATDSRLWVYKYEQ